MNSAGIADFCISKKSIFLTLSLFQIFTRGLKAMNFINGIQKRIIQYQIKHLKQELSNLEK